MLPSVAELSVQLEKAAQANQRGAPEVGVRKQRNHHHSQVKQVKSSRAPMRALCVCVMLHCVRTRPVRAYEKLR